LGLSLTILHIKEPVILFYRLIFLSIANKIACESYQYYRDGNDGPRNVNEYSKDVRAKRLICVKSSEPFKRMVFLNNYPNLETIDANTCGISQIDYNLHIQGSQNSIFLKSLHTLDLSHNNITYIIPNCFYSLLHSLKTLILSHNIITQFAPQAFHHLRVLENLDLSNNNVTFISEKCCKDLQQLKNFSIANNNLHSLHFDLFVNSTWLQTLNFRNNNITMINFNTSPVWSNLMILDLNNNPKNESEQFPIFKHLNLNVPLSQFSRSVEINDKKSHIELNDYKSLIEKSNNMLLIVIVISSSLTFVTTILTVLNYKRQ
jgi:Leucine-rich repeat (LRR) protein